MLLSPDSINHFAAIITGSMGISPARDEETIIATLRKHTECESFDVFFQKQKRPADIADQSNLYVIDKLNKIRGTHCLTDLVEKIFNSPSFFYNPLSRSEPYSLEECLSSFNACLSYKNEQGVIRDNYLVTKVKTKYRVYGLNDCIVDYRCLFTENNFGNCIAIQDHIKKCINRINTEDYSGAITSSRSLLEQILREIELKLNPSSSTYDGDLPKLMKRVLKLIKLTDNDIPENIRTIYSQILGGLNNTINGFSGMSNNMGDRHCITYPPNKKEALLSVNTAKTLANFLVEHYFEKYVIGQV